jgi:hypothetical protein
MIEKISVDLVVTHTGACSVFHICIFFREEEERMDKAGWRAQPKDGGWRMREKAKEDSWRAGPRLVFLRLCHYSALRLAYDALKVHDIKSFVMPYCHGSHHLK